MKSLTLSRSMSNWETLPAGRWQRIMQNQPAPRVRSIRVDACFLTKFLPQIAGTGADVEEANQFHKVCIKSKPARFSAEIEILGARQIA